MAQMLTIGEKKCRQSTNSLPGHEEVDHHCLILNFLSASGTEKTQTVHSATLIF